MDTGILQIMHQLSVRTLRYIIKDDFSTEDIKEAAEFELSYRNGLLKAAAENRT